MQVINDIIKVYTKWCGSPENTVAWLGNVEERGVNSMESGKIEDI